MEIDKNVRVITLLEEALKQPNWVGFENKIKSDFLQNLRANKNKE